MSLTPDEPVTIVATDKPLRHVLLSFLKNLDLELIVENEDLVVTSSDRAHERAIARIYWFDKPAGQATNLNDAIVLITRIVEPDAWVDNGGQSRMEPVAGIRRGLVISTTIDVHDQIESLLKSLGYL